MAGQGDFPLRSAWLGRGRGRGRGANPRKVVNTAATNNANESVWKDWAFNASAPAATGTLAVSETGADTASLSGTVAWTPITGALAATETGSDSASAAGDVLVQGAFAASESGTDAASLSGDVLVQGALSATEAGSDGFAASGTVGTPAVSGSLATSEAGSDTASLSGAVLIAGSLASTEAGADVALFSGGPTPIVGAMAATESGLDGFAASGSLSGVPQTALHGRPVRKIRGRVVRFADEIDEPIRTAADLAEAKAEIAELKAEKQALSFDLEQVLPSVSGVARAAALEALQAEIDRVSVELAAVERAEQAYWKRLRDDDEFILLAA